MASFCLFLFFSTTFLQKFCRVQRDSNFEHWSIRRAWSPLEHHHHGMASHNNEWHVYHSICSSLVRLLLRNDQILTLTYRRCQINQNTTDKNEEGLEQFCERRSNNNNNNNNNSEIISQIDWAFEWLSGKALDSEHWYAATQATWWSNHGDNDTQAMELFSRRRWRLVSAQAVSCCVYENTKQ